VATLTEVPTPDIGDFDDVPVTEVLVAVGDVVAQEDPLVVLESDKATMEVPAPFAGTVAEIRVKEGDTVSEGTVLVVLDTDGAPGGGQGDGGGASSDGDGGASTAGGSGGGAGSGAGGGGRAGGGATAPSGSGSGSGSGSSDGGGSGTPGTSGGPSGGSTPGPTAGEGAGSGSGARSAGGAAARTGSGGAVYASPTVRRLARERGIDLDAVEGTGRNGRITREDVEEAATFPHASDESAVRPSSPSSAPSDAGASLGLAPWPKVKFERFGEVERIPLTRIQKLAGANLARNWVRIPHVTHSDEADITELEAFRKRLNAEQQDVKVTMVALLLKAVSASLKEHPRLNSSLDGDELVLRKYHHLGFAADTPNGLVVPVIRDVDRKGILQLAAELTDLSGKARAGTLSPSEMSGGTFSISSLGGIGGTVFTPIVNAPEVAILGVTRSVMKPVWDGEAFQPRLMLPLSLSYDHRVVDGALAARFCVHLSKVLNDLRRVLL